MRKSDTAASLHAVNLPPAPKGLSGESSRLWRAVVEGFDLPPHALMTLHVAAQAPPPALAPFLHEVRSSFPPIEAPRRLGPDAERLAVAFARRVLAQTTPGATA